MITGGQKQTSVWAANNTREQLEDARGGGRRVAVVMVEVMMGWRRERRVGLERWLVFVVTVGRARSRRSLRAWFEPLRLSQRKGKQAHEAQ
jgi:hypothetical protein